MKKKKYIPRVLTKEDVLKELKYQEIERHEMTIQLCHEWLKFKESFDFVIEHNQWIYSHQEIPRHLSCMHSEKLFESKLCVDCVAQLQAIEHNARQSFSGLVLNSGLLK